jgi:hypothetical protein
VSVDADEVALRRGITNFGARNGNAPSKKAKMITNVVVARKRG